MSGLPIPDDWDEAQDGFCTMQFTVPNSPAWKAITKGAILNLADEWRWDDTNGDPAKASEIAFNIFDSGQTDCS